MTQSELKGRKGRTIVSRKLHAKHMSSAAKTDVVCTDDCTNRNIREKVLEMLDKSIHLEELEFRPYNQSSERRWRLLSWHSREIEHVNGVLSNKKTPSRVGRMTDV